MKITEKQKLVMIGDSITDTGRARPIAEGHGQLGNGYVAMVDALISGAYPDRQIRVVNVGISGNTVRDLKDRWTTDMIEQKPDWLSVMIGTNDVWRHFAPPRRPEALILPEEYEATYREILREVRPSLKGLVLMTPFYIEPNKSEPMRARMDEYGALVKKVAADHDAIFVDTQAAFDRATTTLYPGMLAGDRVHPNPHGHAILAMAFLKAIGFSM
ncbi:MAG TPA: SGNH/GDSL hydrolase family protein [Tepidisphaeraceae bacterium]|jgi:lysophospholipase L1-like esterase|nr:SGNH/GDSL hydrolase family protein [Tepidisphaeraceae bacterium]